MNTVRFGLFLLVGAAFAQAESPVSNESIEMESNYPVVAVADAPAPGQSPSAIAPALDLPDVSAGLERVLEARLAEEIDAAPQAPADSATRGDEVASIGY